MWSAQTAFLISVYLVSTGVKPSAEFRINWDLRSEASFRPLEQEHGEGKDWAVESPIQNVPLMPKVQSEA